MCDLIETAEYVRRNGYGLPVHDDTEYMGANVIPEDTRSVPEFVKQAVAENKARRQFAQAVGWAFLTGLFFGALIAAGVVSFWSLL